LVGHKCRSRLLGSRRVVCPPWPSELVVPAHRLWVACRSRVINLSRLLVPLVAIPVTLATTAPSSGAGPSIPVVSHVARVATANRLALPPPVPHSLPLDASTTLGSAGEASMERLVGRLRASSAVFRTSVPPVSMVDLFGSLDNDSIAWAEIQSLRNPNPLEAVLQGWSRSGVNDQLWRLLNIHQQRQKKHLRRTEPAGNWRDRGSGTGDRREDGAGAAEKWSRDAPGSPQRGTSGGGPQDWGSEYFTEPRPRCGTQGENTRGYGRKNSSLEGPSRCEGPSATRRRLD